MADTCVHLSQISEHISPQTLNGCEECLVGGDSWVSLRICLNCGHVGCCDSSKNKHAVAHFHEVSHPIIETFGSSEKWKWCYVHEMYVE